MAFGFGWVCDERLAGMARPPESAWSWLAEQGIRAVLSLSERAPPGAPGHAGLDVLHVPVPDFEAPSDEELARCIAFIDGHVQAARPVVVHCDAGRGRTGTVLAAWLVADGLSAEEALRLVRERRPGSVETAEQEEAVRRVERLRRERRGGDSR